MDKNDTQISMSERLSALLDDEVGLFEQKRILDELQTNHALSRKLSNFALIGESMRSGEFDKMATTVDSSFLSGIHAKIKAEDQYHDVQLRTHSQNHTGNATSPKSWLRPIGGFALAASVAAIAVIGLQNYQQLDQSSIETASNGTTQASSQIVALRSQENQLTQKEMDAAIDVPVDTLIASNDEQYQQADLQTRSLLKRYVDSHMQYASTAAFVPSVRAIAYADNK